MFKFSQRYILFPKLSGMQMNVHARVTENKFLRQKCLKTFLCEIITILFASSSISQFFLNVSTKATTVVLDPGKILK